MFCVGWEVRQSYWFTERHKLSHFLSVSLPVNPSASLTWTFTFLLPDFLRISSRILIVSFSGWTIPGPFIYTGEKSARRLRSLWLVGRRACRTCRRPGRRNSLSGWDQTREQDTRSSAGREKRKLRFETRGKMEKRRTKEQKKRASRKMCVLRWICPSSRFFCQLLKWISRWALWVFEETVCTVQ